MIDKERQPERAHERFEQKEYSFEQGVEQALVRIEDLLSKKDYVVVGVAGPLPLDINVGKSTLVGAIGRGLAQRNIPRVSTYIGDTVDEHVIKSLLMQQEEGQKKGVIILSASSSLRYRKEQDTELVDMGNRFGLPLSKIDIGILIYRIDREPDNSEKQAADILIKNEKAKDK